MSHVVDGPKVHLCPQMIKFKNGVINVYFTLEKATAYKVHMYMQCKVNVFFVHKYMKTFQLGNVWHKIKTVAINRNNTTSFVFFLIKSPNIYD